MKLGSSVSPLMEDDAVGKQQVDISTVFISSWIKSQLTIEKVFKTIQN